MMHSMCCIERQLMAVHTAGACVPLPQPTNAGSLSSTVWCLQAGINYGPPGNKQLIYFVDDLNMPKLDPYETAMPVSLIRQHLGWGHWFDRSKLTQKNINNTQ